MNNRWINALVKTIITVVVIHAIMLVLGAMFGNQIGWFDYPMVWAHWHSSGDISIGIVCLLVLYFGIYACCTKGCNRIESEKRD